MKKTLRVLKQGFLIAFITLGLALTAFGAFEYAARKNYEANVPPLVHVLKPAYGHGGFALSDHPTWSLRLIPAPFVAAREHPARKNKVTIADHGFRATSQQASYERGARRLLVHGGAMTFGYGLNDEETMPSVLQDRLTSHGYELFNFSSAFFRLRDNRADFARRLVAGEAPLGAVFVFGWADFVFAAAGEDHPLGAFRLEWRDHQKSWHAFIQSSYSYRLFRQWSGKRDPISLQKVGPGITPATSEQMKVAAEKILNEIEIIRVMAEAHGVRVWFALEPAVHPHQDAGYAYLLPALDGAPDVLRLTADPRKAASQPQNAQILYDAITRSTPRP